MTDTEWEAFITEVIGQTSYVYKETAGATTIVDKGVKAGARALGVNWEWWNNFLFGNPEVATYR